MRLKTTYLVLLNLATIAALITVDNKTPNVKGLVKIVDYNVKISKWKKIFYFF